MTLNSLKYKTCTLYLLFEIAQMIAFDEAKTNLATLRSRASYLLPKLP